MVKISYITITARDNYPTAGRSDLHLWEPTLRTLRAQTFQDFEYIIVDCFYHERADYFKDVSHNYGLRIKHIPAGPNIWSERGVVQTCEQFNKGVIYADVGSELLFFDADSAMLHPQLMSNLWVHYKAGYFVSLGFGADLTYSKDIYERQLGADGIYKNTGVWQGVGASGAKSGGIVPNWFADLGYSGLIVMDHRYRLLFEDEKGIGIRGSMSAGMSEIKGHWYYGISTVSLDAFLKVNGFDVSFDGDSALNDVDLGNRLVMARDNGVVREKLAMFRDSYIIEAYAKSEWHKGMRAIRPEIKCNYGLVLYNKILGKYRANVGAIDVDYIIGHICGKLCDVRDKCKGMIHRGPFFNKNELGENGLYEHWKKYGSTYKSELKFERERRILEGRKEGTWVNI